MLAEAVSTAVRNSGVRLIAGGEQFALGDANGFAL